MGTFGSYNIKEGEIYVGAAANSDNGFELELKQQIFAKTS